jgi:hypothetical protein
MPLVIELDYVYLPCHGFSPHRQYVTSIGMETGHFT